MKKLFKLPKDLQKAWNNAIKEVEEDIKNNPPILIAKKKKDKLQEIMANVWLEKWWKKNGIKLMKKVVGNFEK